MCETFAYTGIIGNKIAKNTRHNLSQDSTQAKCLGQTTISSFEEENLGINRSLQTTNTDKLCKELESADKSNTIWSFTCMLWHLI